MSNKIPFFILQACVAFLPAGLILYYALHAGALPDNDYWAEIVAVITPQGEFSTHLHDWFRRSNEHYTLLPKIVYAVNLALTGGNNIALSLFAWLMAWAQLVLLVTIFPVKYKQQAGFFTLLLLITALCLFNPRQAHNWILGMSGTAWIAANFFSLASLVALHRYVASKSRLNFSLIFVFGLCAVATYSTSLGLFCTLMIAAFLYPLNTLERVSISVFSIIVLGLYLGSYSTPDYHPPIQRSAFILANYFFNFIGGFFTVQLNGALISGIFGVVSSLLMVLSIYRNKIFRNKAIPWVCIQLYACANAAMAALARSGFGLDLAFSSRYGSLPALFWLAWIMLAVMVSMPLRRQYRHSAYTLILLVSALITINSYRIGHDVAKPLLERAERKFLTLAALYSHAYDLRLITSSIATDVKIEAVEKIVSSLVTSQHIPFDGRFKDCPEMGNKISQAMAGSSVLGSFDQLNLRNDQVIEVMGWAYEKGLTPRCIALTNQDNIVRGVASYGLLRRDVTQAVAEVLSANTGWQGYGKLYKHDKLIKVYMLTAERHWVLLNGRFQIHRQPLKFEKIVSLYDGKR